MNRQQRRAAARKGEPPAGPGTSPALDPAFAQAAHLHMAGRLPEAEPLLRQVLARNPRHGDALHLLGAINLQAGKLDLAAEFLQKAIAADGGQAQFHNNLGCAYRALGRPAEAITAFRRAVSIKPDYARAWVNLGGVLSPDNPAGAADCFEQALSVTPGSVDILEALVEVRLAQNLILESVSALRRLLQVKPNSPERWVQLGYMLAHAPDIAGALDAYRQALNHRPDLAQAYNGVANCLADLGQLEGSVAAYREAIRLDPDNLEARSNLLMTLHSLPGVSAADILQDATAFAARLGPRPEPRFANTPDADRPLRVGYVSADFRVHPVGFFLDRVLPAHDTGQVQPILYSDTLFHDELTARLEAAAPLRNIVGLSHAEVAAMIQADGIDILVDLAGHTASNRLPLFAARPAPVQAAWLGYFGTTGLDAIDHVIADEIVLPPDEEALFTERPVRLASPYLCWSPPVAEVSVGPPPALGQGFVTFGCFNNPRKITDQAITVWAEILQRVEGSRLLLKYWAMTDPARRAYFVQAFAAHGIGQERLVFEDLSPRGEGLAAYNRIDIALDPFPFGGCTTTADTLWMGVPVVALAGERWSGRMSQTILSGLGLGDWVASDTKAYIGTAVRLAADLPALAGLRAELRARIEGSAFCDGPGFTLRLEQAFRGMWRSWTAGPRS